MRCLTLIFLLSFFLASTFFAQKNGRTDREPVDKMFPEYLFIIKNNKTYGLGENGSFNLNSPTGDTVFHLGDHHFAVRNKSRYAIYDDTFHLKLTNLITVKEFGNFIITIDSAGSKIYSKKEKRSSQYFDSIKVLKEYALLYRKGKQGIICISDELADLIQPLYDYVGPYFNGILLIDNNKLGWKGPIEIPVNYDHIYKERDDIIAAKNVQGVSYFSLNKKFKLKIEPDDSLVLYDRAYYKRVRSNRESVFSLETDSLVAESSEYQLHPFCSTGHCSSHYMVASRAGRCGLFKSGRLITGLDFDNILPESHIQPPYFRTVKNGKVGIVHESGEYQLQNLYTDVLERSKDYYIVRKNHKLGIHIKNDSVILPCNYRSIWFSEDKPLAQVSVNGLSVGLFDCERRKQIVPSNYEEINIQNMFILGRKGQSFDVYIDDKLKIDMLTDVQIHRSTVKGYKDGRVHLGYASENDFKEYSYQIPIYKVAASEPPRYFAFNNTALHETTDLYDYGTAKWGRYNFPFGKWIDTPFVHSGNKPGSERILALPADTTIRWKEINFEVKSAVVGMSLGWTKNAAVHWMDVGDHSYYKESSYGQNITVSPVYYAVPGKGHFSNLGAYRNVNFVFDLNVNRSVFVRDGRVEIGRDGEINLSKFITQLSDNGNVHPKEISDYKKLIDPSAYISIKNGIEQILQSSSSGQPTLSIHNQYQWVSKSRTRTPVVKLNSKYGLLSDSGSFILPAVYESIEPIEKSFNLFRVGKPGNIYHLYDPVSKKFSRPIVKFRDAKDELLLVGVNNNYVAVLNSLLDTLILTKNKISLLGGQCYSEQAGENKVRIYNGKSILFTAEALAVEKVNDRCFILRTFKENIVTDSSGRELFTTSHAVHHFNLGDKFLLDDGKSKRLFDNEYKPIHSFTEKYIITEHRILLIKKSNSLDIVGFNNGKINVTGKLKNAYESYLVVSNGKYKKAYDYAGKTLVTKADRIKYIDNDFLTYKLGKKIYLLDIKTSEKKRVKKLSVDFDEEAIETDTLENNVQSTHLTPEKKWLITQSKDKYGLRSKKVVLLEDKYISIVRLSSHFLVQDALTYQIFDASRREYLNEKGVDNFYPYKNYYMLSSEGEIYYIKK